MIKIFCTDTISSSEDVIRFLTDNPTSLWTIFEPNTKSMTGEMLIIESTKSVFDEVDQVDDVKSGDIFAFVNVNGMTMPSISKSAFIYQSDEDKIQWAEAFINLMVKDSSRKISIHDGLQKEEAVIPILIGMGTAVDYFNHNEQVETLTFFPIQTDTDIQSTYQIDAEYLTSYDVAIPTPEYLAFDYFGSDQDIFYITSDIQSIDDVPEMEMDWAGDDVDNDEDENEELYNEDDLFPLI